MSDDSFVLMVNLSKLVAVNEYLRERGDDKVCVVLIVLLMVFKLYYVIQNKNKLWKLLRL